MKTTTFEIDVHCSSENADEQFATLIARLLKLTGVESVQRLPAISADKLLVGALFSDADEAKRIHAKIMDKIMTSKQFQVRGITTNLSDVFS